MKGFPYTDAIRPVRLFPTWGWLAAGLFALLPPSFSVDAQTTPGTKRGGEARADATRDDARPPASRREPGGPQREPRGPMEQGRPRGPRGQGGKAEPRGDAKQHAHDYSIEQAISDQAQLHTIAFDGLAFLSGDFGASTFIPPGKVCDYFGFQYLRDIDAASKGHNPIFLNRVVGNMLHILSEDQKRDFLRLATEQGPQLEELARLRLPLIKAFHLQLERPTAADGTPRSGQLDREKVMQYVGEIFAKDAELCFKRAEVMGKIARSLNVEQKEYLSRMKFGDFNTWPELDARDVTGPRPKSHSVNVAFMTYLSEFYSWTAGSVEADVYFCPERHGTYFGGFFMKDMPAMGQRNFDISTSVTGDSGEAFLNDVLTTSQRQVITAILDQQRQAIRETVSVRRAISQELRRFLKEDAADREKVLELGRKYGELDGEMSWYYATAFARVNATLTEAQRAQLRKLRNLDQYESAPYYIFSQAMRSEPTLPDIEKQFFSPDNSAGK